MYSEAHKASPEAVRAVAAAAQQITVALQEAQRPVEQLGASVSRIIVTVGALRSVSEGLEIPAHAGNLRSQINEAIGRLSQDASQATVTLQFYDRMTQHLTHLQDYLAHVSELLAAPQCVSGVEGDSRGWRELRERLGRRLMSDLQRHGLQGVTTTDINPVEMADADGARRAPDGSVELF